LLLVEPENKNVRATRIGGSSDISAGQIMDRTGKMLGLSFPSGKQMDMLSAEVEKPEFFKVKTSNMTFSFSGLENKVAAYASAGHTPQEIAAYAVRSVCNVIVRTTKDALMAYPGLAVVFSGGVASNSMLRKLCAGFDPVFATQQLSTDNAMGIAILTWLHEEY